MNAVEVISGGLYIGSAIVIRDSEEKGYAYLKRPELMSFVAVSAYSNPPTETAKNGVRHGGKGSDNTR